jgi:hypothetical protein
VCGGAGGSDLEGLDVSGKTPEYVRCIVADEIEGTHIRVGAVYQVVGMNFERMQPAKYVIADNYGEYREYFPQANFIEWVPSAGDVVFVGVTVFTLTELREPGYWRAVNTSDEATTLALSDCKPALDVRPDLDSAPVPVVVHGTPPVIIPHVPLGSTPTDEKMRRDREERRERERATAYKQEAERESIDLHEHLLFCEGNESARASYLAMVRKGE